MTKSCQKDLGLYCIYVVLIVLARVVFSRSICSHQVLPVCKRYEASLGCPVELFSCVRLSVIGGLSVCYLFLCFILNFGRDTGNRGKCQYRGFYSCGLFSDP